MPSIGTELKNYLLTINAIRSRIGNGADARIYYEAAKQTAATPYVVYTVFSGTSYEHLGSTVIGSGLTGLADNRIQIDCYGDDDEQAFALAEAVRLAPLQNYRGLMGGTFVHTVSSGSSYTRGFDPPTRAGDTRRYWYSRDYIIVYEENAVIYG